MPNTLRKREAVKREAVRTGPPGLYLGRWLFIRGCGRHLLSLKASEGKSSLESIQIHIPALPHARCVTLDKSVNSQDLHRMLVVITPFTG
jgi:hypothetical protein